MLHIFSWKRFCSKFLPEFQFTFKEALLTNFFKNSFEKGRKNHIDTTNIKYK